MKFIPILFLLCLLYACQLHSSSGNDEAVASVFDTDLMRSEVVAFIPPKTGKDDSVLMAQSYIRNWVTKQLLLHKATENLSEEEKNIQKQVEDYRTSLLIHRYKQKLITQKLSEEIEREKIEQYYRENEVNFILPTPVVKAVFFILPKSAPNLDQIRKWYKSDQADDREKIEDYCITHAKKYDNFNNKWVELKFILNLIPEDVNRLENEIRYNKNIEKEDEENYYFLKISELCKEQTVAPLDYVYEEITLILKNKKKLQFESELEKQINEEAVRKKNVKIY